MEQASSLLIPPLCVSPTIVRVMCVGDVAVGIGFGNVLFVIEPNANVSNIT